MKATYPQTLILEVLETNYGFPVSANTCSNWISQNGLTHVPLRDQGGANGVATVLAMATYDLLVMDRYLKIVYRGSLANPSTQAAVLSKVATLK